MRTAPKHDDTKILNLAKAGHEDYVIAARCSCPETYVAKIRNENKIPKPRGDVANPTRKIFTTGQVAKICKVAPRTVSKWFDAGKFKKGYRIPGSQDRRVPRESLIEFLKEHSMPLGNLGDSDMPTFCVLLVGAAELLPTLRENLSEDDGYKFETVATPFEAGMKVIELRPQVVLFDFAAGRSDAIAAAKVMSSTSVAWLGCIVAEDEGEQATLRDTFNGVFQRPFNPLDIGQWVDELKQRLERE